MTGQPEFGIRGIPLLLVVTVVQTDLTEHLSVRNKFAYYDGQVRLESTSN